MVDRARLWIGCCAVATIGCGGGTSESLIESRQSASQAYDAAIVAFDVQDFTLANEKFSAALDVGGLYSELYDEVHAKRAVCRAALGDFDAAHAELDLLEKASQQKGLVYAARSFVLEKQGKAQEARAIFKKARRFDRSVQRFKG